MRVLPRVITLSRQSVALPLAIRSMKNESMVERQYRSRLENLQVFQGKLILKTFQ
jgi:hypothetical protein